ncbi:hypothetical protein [Actinomadura fibrosa]|uniref:Uncharacterized protein n=1 Tax=Actinomadura fibrosa TaxID=111802 RepID=A0ABW2XR55_9ACTN|nr:hypothetical protein [Actinomadura fibrosa]
MVLSPDCPGCGSLDTDRYFSRLMDDLTAPLTKLLPRARSMFSDNRAFLYECNNCDRKFILCSQCHETRLVKSKTGPGDSKRCHDCGRKVYIE